MKSSAIVFLLLAGHALPAMAVQWSEAEMKVMPPYCEARLKRVPTQFEHWNKVLGPDFIHTHHYCHGLGFINRFYGLRTQKERNEVLHEAYNQLSYVVMHAQPTFSLMPDVYLNRGLVLSLMGQSGKAIVDLKKAIELNHRLVKAYALASDIQFKLNQKEEALALVSEGLRHVPDSARLKRLYKERGGKLPYPEPIARPTEEAAVPDRPAANAKPSTAEASAGVPAASQELTSPSSNTAAGVDSQLASPKIGAPGNPWCRFCPESAK